MDFFVFVPRFVPLVYFFTSHRPLACRAWSVSTSEYSQMPSAYVAEIPAPNPLTPRFLMRLLLLKSAGAAPELEATQRGKHAALPQLLFHLSMKVLLAIMMREAAGQKYPSSERSARKGWRPAQVHFERTELGSNGRRSGCSRSAGVSINRHDSRWSS